jgi:hypothetical protein
LETTITPAVSLLSLWSRFDQYNIPCVDMQNIPLVLPQLSSSSSNGSVITIASNTLPASASLTATVDNSNLNAVWSEVSGLLSNFSNIIDSAFTIRISRLIIKPSSHVAGQTYVYQAAVESDPRAKTSVSIPVNCPRNMLRVNHTRWHHSDRIVRHCGQVQRAHIRLCFLQQFGRQIFAVEILYGYVSSNGVSSSFDLVSDASQSYNLPIGFANLICQCL